MIKKKNSRQSVGKATNAATDNEVIMQTKALKIHLMLMVMLLLLFVDVYILLYAHAYARSLTRLYAEWTRVEAYNIYIQQQIHF